MRGLAQWLQDMRGNVQGITHTPNSKIARQWGLLTNWDPATKTFSKIHLDETRNTFDRWIKRYCKPNTVIVKPYPMGLSRHSTVVLVSRLARVG